MVRFKAPRFLGETRIMPIFASKHAGMGRIWGSFSAMMATMILETGARVLAILRRDSHAGRGFEKIQLRRLQRSSTYLSQKMNTFFY